MLRRILAGLLFLTSSLVATAGGVLRDVMVEGPVRIAPGSGPTFDVTWSGGTSPWTVDFLATDPAFDFSQQFIVTNSACQAGLCRASGFFANFNLPQISTITATVTDSIGASVTSSPLRVRVGTSDPIHLYPGPTVDIRPDPQDMNRFLCTGGAEDVPLIDVYGDLRFPTIDVVGDPRVSNPNFLRVSAEEANGAFIGFAYGVADTDWVNEVFPPPELDIVLDFPLAYGDYDQPDTVPYQNPQMPSPALAEGKVYTAAVPRPPECTDSFQTRFQEFALNPPDEGGVVVMGDDTTTINGETVGEIFARLAERDRITTRRQAFAACVRRDLLEAIFAVLTYRGGEFSIYPEFVEDVAFTILTNPAALQRIRELCAQRLDAPAEADASKGLATVNFDLEIEAGTARIQVVDPAIVLQTITEFAAVTTAGLAEYVVQNAPSLGAVFLPVDQALQIVPANAALPAFTLSVGEFVAVEADQVIGPTPLLIFASGFED